MRRIWIAVGLGLIVFTLGAAAFQWTNDKKDKPRDRSHRDVTGIVMLQDETPVGGAVVKLKNMRNLQVRSFITQADGKYTFQNLSSTVDFELKAEYKGMTSTARTLTIYDTRPDPIINLKLEPAKK
jgi:hypothetical protein